MLWHNLRLRTRMLLGYGLMFGLIAIVMLFLILRNGALNTQIRDLSAEVSTEAATGAQLAAQVATVQQEVDRYLLQPKAENLRAANATLQRLGEQLKQSDTLLVSSEQRQRLHNLAGKLVAYQNNLQALSDLLDAQRGTSAALYSDLFDATNDLNRAITAFLRTDSPSPSRLSAFVNAQRNLQLSILWSARLVSEQSESHGESAIDKLSLAQLNLHIDTDQFDDTTEQAIVRVVEGTQHAQGVISQYTANLAKIRQQHDTLQNVEGAQLKNQADAIAGAALSRLTTATNDLERQSQQTQQLILAALIATLLIAAVFGWLLPRTMTQPLMQLVAATKRLNQGDYGMVVSTRDGSEIGQLAEAFNQMTAALGHEHDQVLRQQQALAKQNREQEQTLAELQASTAAREKLAVAVRTLSVPVVPILEGVILIPLVGEIDAERAQILLEQLLDSITKQRARIAILDITGVAVVDTSLVGWLLRATSSARLMGARCMLVGISPEVAQALVASGAELEDLSTRADLRSAVEHAIRSNGAIAARN